VKARAFFVGIGVDLDREARLGAKRPQRGDCFDRGYDPELPIVSARIAHGIEMRTQDQGWPLRDRGEPAADEVSDGVHARRKARFIHPADDAVRRGAVLRRKIEALVAVPVGRNPSQLRTTGHDSRSRTGDRLGRIACLVIRSSPIPETFPGARTTWSSSGR
jgi:hypothetical protein